MARPIHTVTESIREQRKSTNVLAKQRDLAMKIQQDYLCYGKHLVTKANHKNIMLIGRTRTGKSCIKTLLIDPTKVPDELTLKSGTREPLFESFHAKDNEMVLNIIDTPGLFERGTSEIDIRDNDTIMRTIQFCVNMEITKFHVICFCIAITNGINSEDIKSLELLIDFLGRELTNNSCLIITHCESKTEDQLDNYKKELLEDQFFKNIASYFKLGIYFTGSLNRDDFVKGNESVLDQYVTISAYRDNLINLFTCDSVEPFPISQMLISQMSATTDDLIKRQLDIAREKSEEQKQIINQLLDRQDRDKQQIDELMRCYRELVIEETKAQADAHNYEVRYKQALDGSQAKNSSNNLVNSPHKKTEN